LSRIHFLLGLLALSLAVGCKAQPASQGAPDPALDRRIEVMVRTQYNVPAEFNIVLGTRKPSQVTGYDTLPVTVSRGATQKIINFLISTDNKTLARLETFDLAKIPGMAIDTAGRPIRGNPAAKVTVINFDDLECPYCSRMHQSLFPSTMDRYKDKVRFIYKDDPLTELHPWAMHAAVDANCLAAQSGDVYWAYVDYLHSHGQEITGEDRNLNKSFAALDRIARQEGTVAKLDDAKLNACLSSRMKPRSAPRPRKRMPSELMGPQPCLLKANASTALSRGSGLAGHRPCPARRRRGTAPSPASVGASSLRTGPAGAQGQVGARRIASYFASPSWTPALSPRRGM